MEALSKNLNHSGGAKKKQASLGEKKSLPLISTKPRSNTVAVPQADHIPPTVSRAKEKNATLEGCQPELNKMTQLIEILTKKRRDHLYPEAQALLEIAQSAFSAMNSKLLKEFEKLLLQDQRYQLNSWRIDNTFEDIRNRMIDFYDQIFRLRTVLKFEKTQIVKQGKSIDENDQKIFFRALGLYLDRDARCYNTLKGYKNTNFFTDIQVEDLKLIKNHFLNKSTLIDDFINKIGTESKDLDIKKDDGKKVYVAMEDDSMHPALKLLQQIPGTLSFDAVACTNLQDLIIKRMNFRKKLTSEEESAKLVVVGDWLKTIKKAQEQLKQIETAIANLADLENFLQALRDESTQQLDGKNDE